MSFMVGRFSNKEQHLEVNSFVDSILEVRRIWEDRSPAHYWLYVEQSLRDKPEEPFFQRIWKLIQLSPNLFKSETYALPNPSKMVDMWLTFVTDQLQAKNLVPRDGCSVLMRKNGKTFDGSTIGTLCPSSASDAFYSTTEVQINPTVFKIWVRGYSDDGKQVWGSEQGTYIYKRLE